MTFKLPRLDQQQRELLRHIADNGDLLDVGQADQRHWLLVPLDARQFARLAEFEAVLEDGHDPLDEGEDDGLR